MSESKRSSRRRPRGWRPLAAGVLTALACSLGWGRLSAGAAPHSTRPDARDSVFYPMPVGIHALLQDGRPGEARTLLVGDSRAQALLDFDEVKGSTHGPFAVLWRHGGDAEEFIDAAERLGPPQTVVCLTPGSIGMPMSPVARELLQGEVPVFDPEGATLGEVHRWALAEQERLVALGLQEFWVEATLEMFKGYHARLRKRLIPGPTRVDFWLGRRFQRWRFRQVHTVRAEDFKWGLFGRVEPGASAPIYESILHGGPYAAQFEAERAKVVAALRALAGSSDVLVVRPAVHPLIREVEDRAIAPEDFAAIAGEAGVPFIDHGTTTATRDGSHVDVEGAVEESRRLLGELDRVFGAGDGGEER